MAGATMLQIHKYFKDNDPDYTLKAFRADWEQLSDTDKEQLKAGLGDGTLTY